MLLPTGIMSKIVTMLDIVKSILNRFPETRDDDNLLVAKVWWSTMVRMSIDPRETTAVNFMELYKDGQLPPTDVITQTSLKAQLENPELRGGRWEERKK